ncbi:MAG: cupin domain-containing protein [Erysipelothrix sp.]|nr:cupin domain-containing protein [Erysipelothrix sp.]
MDIGKKMRKYRVQNGLTLEELASRSELSKGFLSQIENDITSPSISTLNDIVEVLGMDLSSFFKDDKEEQIVFTSDDYFVDEKEHATLHWIVPNAQKNDMEPILLELAEDGESQEVLPHEGEEFGYVLEGKVTLIHGDESLELRKGQTFYIKGEQTHKLINKHKQKAKVIWVCTPPIF